MKNIKKDIQRKRHKRIGKEINIRRSWLEKKEGMEVRDKREKR